MQHSRDERDLDLRYVPRSEEVYLWIYPARAMYMRWTTCSTGMGLGLHVCDI